MQSERGNFFHGKLASNTIQVHQGPKFPPSLKQGHRAATKCIKVYPATSRCKQVHQGMSRCINRHPWHPATSRVILSINRHPRHPAAPRVNLSIGRHPRHPAASRVIRGINRHPRHLSIQLHRGSTWASVYIQDHNDDDRHPRHSAASRVTLSIHRHPGSSWTSVDIQDIQLHQGSSIDIQDIQLHWGLIWASVYI